MRENTRNMINKFLLDNDMFKRIFINSSLLNDNDIEQIERTLSGLSNFNEINSRNLLVVKIKLFYEENLSRFIPIKLDDEKEIILFFELFITIHKYHKNNN